MSNMGERAIKSHAKGKKHCDRLALCIQSSSIKFMLVSKGSAVLHLLVQVLWVNLYCHKQPQMLRVGGVWKM